MQAIYQKGSYSLQDEKGIERGRLVKEGTFTCKTHIETQDGHLEFVKHSIFSPTKINRNGREMGEVRSSWDSLVFKLDLEGRIQQLRLCRKNFWKSTFKLINEYRDELVVVVPQFKWRKMSYDYRIEISPKYSLTQSPFILLLAVYGVRKLLERQYAAS